MRMQSIWYFAAVAGVVASLWVAAPPSVSRVAVEKNGDGDIKGVRLDFTRPIRRTRPRARLTPSAQAEISFENPLFGRHLYTSAFIAPKSPLQQGTPYTLVVEGIQGFGFPQERTHENSFIAPEQKRESIVEEEGGEEIFSALKEGVAEAVPERSVILPVPVHFQEDALSCEAASVKMALAAHGITVSEDEIMEKIGYATKEPMKNGVWGDPNEGYVGDIDGIMCKTGFGVFEDPVARAVRTWRGAEILKNGTIRDITEAIDKGNPVVVWGRMPTRTITSCFWRTTKGKFVGAFRETHVRLVVGYSGSAQNPSTIVLNDPLAGRLYWPTEDFWVNWALYGNTGVIVR